MQAGSVFPRLIIREAAFGLNSGIRSFGGELRELAPVSESRGKMMGKFSYRRSCMKRCLTCLLVAFSATVCSTSLAVDRVPIQAALLRALDVAHVKVGDSVLAKVSTKWESADCVLREGAILKGRVVAQLLHSKTNKISEVALLFDSAECGGPTLKPLPLTVAAIMAGDPRRDNGMYESQPLSDAVGLTLNGGVRSLSSASSTVFNEPNRYKGPTSVRPGEVLGIKGVQIKVGNGPEGSSVLTSAGHNVRLDQGSLLVLVPNLVASSAITSGTPIPASPVNSADGKEAAALDLADETEGCSPPQCNVSLNSSEPAEGTAAWSSLSVKDFGYSRSQRDLYSFDYDAALVYVDDAHLLFTFNPHLLIPRSGLEGKLSRLRIIRALLIDVRTKKVVKTVDWKVPDDRQYLWTIDAGRILVHTGSELRIYGPSLKSEQRLSLAGQLAFVRISPSSNYFAVGTFQERHSEAVHREIEDAEAREPEEDVEVRILDANLKTLASVVRSSRIPTPVLSNNGEIRILQASRNRWSIVENSWDAQKRNVGIVRSTCRPEVTSFPPDLLFVTGCDQQMDGKWYRVLRPNGKPVLKGWSPAAQLERRIVAPASDFFSLGIAEAYKSLTPGAPFRSTDVKNERIGVYRSLNGERAFEVSIASPIPTVQTFSLSPDGSQLAVLKEGQIDLYRVPGAR